MNAKVIFDNGGGTTVQLNNGKHHWSHYYSDAADAAASVRWAILSGSFYDFEGDEPEAISLAPTADEVRNGCYRIEHFASVEQLADHAHRSFESGWWNERNFARSNLSWVL